MRLERTLGEQQRELAQERSRVLENPLGLSKRMRKIVAHGMRQLIVIASANAVGRPAIHVRVRSCVGFANAFLQGSLQRDDRLFTQKKGRVAAYVHSRLLF